MRILIISHVYLLNANREKIEALADIPGTEVHLIIPKKWSDYIREIKGVEHGGRKNFKIHQIETSFSGKESTYFYRSIGLKLREIKPDIIFVEQGAKALSYFQTIVYKKIFWRKVKVGFFTWVNLDYKDKFPFSFIEKFNLRNTDFAVAGNQDAKKIIHKHGGKFPIKILPQLGLNETMFKKQNQNVLRKKLGLKGFVIGFVGRFDKEKGIETLLRAAAGLSNWNMLMVGMGKDKDYFIELAKKLGVLDKIKFKAVVPIQELPKYYNCMDVFVLPSLTGTKWKEQFGHTLIEAMSCEVPVIGSDSGEIPNVIGNAGLVFREGYPKGLKEKIEKLMKNKKLRDKYAKAGRGHIIKNYTHKEIANKLHKIFNDAIY